MISKAARCEALKRAARHGHLDMPCGAIDALAEALQEHSDVAKRAENMLPNIPAMGGVEMLLESIILPDDEPENQTECYKQAVRLAEHLARRLSHVEAIDWKPLPDLSGVIDQIDNMTTGFVPADAGYQIVKKEG